MADRAEAGQRTDGLVYGVTEMPFEGDLPLHREARVLGGRRRQWSLSFSTFCSGRYDAEEP